MSNDTPNTATDNTTTYVQFRPRRAHMWVLHREIDNDPASARQALDALRRDMRGTDVEVRMITDAPNVYGGRDYRTPRGMIRTCRDDGQRTLHAFIGSGTCTWTANFSGAPAEMSPAFDTTVLAALTSIDW